MLCVIHCSLIQFHMLTVMWRCNIWCWKVVPMTSRPVGARLVLKLYFGLKIPTVWTTQTPVDDDIFCCWKCVRKVNSYSYSRTTCSSEGILVQIWNLCKCNGGKSRAVSSKILSGSVFCLCLCLCLCLCQCSVCLFFCKCAIFNVQRAESVRLVFCKHAKQIFHISNVQTCKCANAMYKCANVCSNLQCTGSVFFAMCTV